MKKGATTLQPADVEGFLSDPIISEIAERSGLKKAVGSVSFATRLRSAVIDFLMQSSAPDPASIRTELSKVLQLTLRSLNKIDSNKNVDLYELGASIAKISKEAKIFVQERALLIDGSWRCPLFPYQPQFEKIYQSSEAEILRKRSLLDWLMMMLVEGVTRKNNQPLRPTREGFRLKLGPLERRIGNTTDTLLYDLHSPPLIHGRPSNRLVREMVMWIQVAYLHATQEDPPVAAHSEKLGPFGRFVAEVLQTLGLSAVSVPDLINLLDRQRTEMDPSIKLRRKMKRMSGTFT